MRSTVRIEAELYEEVKTCTRCGAIRTKKLETGLCTDCAWEEPKSEKSSTRRLRIEHDGQRFDCQAWLGEFDDDDNPTRNGELYRPGHRSCGHRDCVSLHHIVQVSETAVA